MSDERLNTAIDEVARQMTEGAPADDAGFRRRVLARIESGDAPRRSWHAAFVLSPIAIAAAIVIAVVVARSASGPFAPGVPASAPTTAGSKGPALQPSIVAAVPPGTAVPGPSASARQDPRAPASEAAAAEARSPFEPGVSGAAPHPDTIDAIDLAPLSVDLLAPDPIAIERLETIAPLVVAPLESTEEQRRYE